MIPYEEYFIENALYRGIIAYEDFICLIPGLANQIVIFNKKTEQFESIDMIHKQEWKLGFFFSGAYQYNHFLYCIPGAALKWIRINLKTRELVCLKDFSEYGERYDLHGFNTAQWNKDTIIKPFMDRKDLMFMDLKTETIFHLKTNVDDLNFPAIEIVCIDNYVYMCSSLKEDLFLRKIDLKTGNVVKKIRIGCEIRKLSSVANYIIVDYEGVPRYEMYNMELELIYSGEIKFDKIVNCFRMKRQQGIWKDFGNGMIGCFHNGENLLYMYRTLDMILEKIIDIQVDISCLENLKDRIKKEDGLKQEEHYLYILSDFLEEDMGEKMVNYSKIVGKKIFEAIT